MISFAQRHRDRILAAKQATARATHAVEPSRAIDIQDQKLTLLQNHMIALKEVQSVEEKVRLKSRFLPEYTGYIDGVLAANAGTDDPILATIFVWRMDTGAFESAMELANYMLDHDLKLPEKFKRQLPTFLVEELAEALLTDEGHAALKPVQESLALTADKDMPDEVRAKAHKAVGYALYDDMQELAVDHLEEALRLHKGSGVKTKLADLKKQLAKQAEKDSADKAGN